MNAKSYFIAAMGLSVWGCHVEDVTAAMSDASVVGPGNAPLDAAVDCDDLVKVQVYGGYLPRGCVHQLPLGAITWQQDEELIVEVDGAVIAALGTCKCASMVIEVVPYGTDPATYVPPSCPISTEGYDRACEHNGDCELVFEGDGCDPYRNTCPNVAIPTKRVTALRFL